VWTVIPIIALATVASPAVERHEPDPATCNAVFEGVPHDAVHVLSDVYITTAIEICPQCSGSDVGAAGTCRGGRNNGKSCTVHGKVRVENAPGGDEDFAVSADCPPAGAPVANLPLALDPLTTGTASLSGSKPCPGQTRDDGCTAGGTCTGTCGPELPERGGIPQMCCSNQLLPCFPSATLGRIERVGLATPLVPADGFPATSDAVLASVSCVAPTGVGAVDRISTGLSGPAALLLPVRAQWR
jgi:hypothetical protein